MLRYRYECPFSITHERPPPSPRVCMSIHPEASLVPVSVRVLVLNDPPAWLGDTTPGGELARRMGGEKLRVEKSLTGRFGHVEPSWGTSQMTLKEFFSEVGPCRYCSPHHRARFEPLFPELNS
jgi:hypothetical protein